MWNRLYLVLNVVLTLSALQDNPGDEGSVAVFTLDVVPYCKEILEGDFVYKARNPNPKEKQFEKKKRKRRSIAQINEDLEKERGERFDVEEPESDEGCEEECDVEKECVPSQSDELSLRFALLNILMIRIMGCDLQVSGIPFNNNNVLEIESVVLRNIFQLEEKVTALSSINSWTVLQPRLANALGDSKVFYHDHVATMFRNLPDISRLCFNTAKWALKPSSSLKGKPIKNSKSDVETRNWIRTFIHQTIKTWSLIVYPSTEQSAILFSEGMFSAIASQPTIRNGHVLIRFADSASFEELDGLLSIRYADAKTNGVRFLPKDMLQRVIKPSLYNSSPDRVRELVQTTQYKAVSAAFGPQPQAPRKKTRQRNNGLEYAELALVDGDGAEHILSDEDVLALTRKVASLKKTVGLVANGLEKIAIRLYNSHVSMCGGLNGDALKYLSGNDAYSNDLDEFLTVVICFQRSFGGTFESMMDDGEKVRVDNFFEVVCVVKKASEKDHLEDVLCLNIGAEQGIIPLYSKLGPRSGALVQAFPLAAAEQYLLNPANVICIL